MNTILSSIDKPYFSIDMMLLFMDTLLYSRRITQDFSDHFLCNRITKRIYGVIFFNYKAINSESSGIKEMKRAMI